MKKFEALTALLESLENNTPYGEWVIDQTHKGAGEDPKQQPYVRYADTVFQLINAVHAFSADHPEYQLLEAYQKILTDRGLKWNHKVLESADFEALDDAGVLAVLMGIVRGERFCDGAILSALNKGTIQKGLLRLKQIDEAADAPPA